MLNSVDLTCQSVKLFFCVHVNLLSSSSPRIFLGFLGCGLSLMFCIMFCRTCSRLRAEEIEREVWRRSEHDGRPQSIYFIPFPRGLSQEDSESQLDGVGGENVDEHQTPPRYSITVPRGLPPSYNEVIFIPPKTERTQQCKCLFISCNSFCVVVFLLDISATTEA